eukprot:m.11780 g.11780  ORF g.11780 m.11780 type:complete len:438 (+) comp7041_c0_seq1:146-1459(+)
MGRITISLLRKRAEHNNKELSTLEEISLHQENIERIELLDRACPHLKILYLQNNIISAIEHLHRLKSLVYINLALNNIQVIQNLESLECLEKLDLTINFIFNVKDVDRLKANEHLRELYLTGNPCASYSGYREYVITALPNLELLDGKEILKSERIKAKQLLPDLMDDINESIEENTPDEVITTSGALVGMDSSGPFNEDDDEEQRKYWQEEVEHTPRGRYEMHKKQEAMQQAEELKKNPPKPKKIRKFFKDDGTPLNMNEGDWDFRLEGQDMYSENLVLDFPCYKYVDTSQIDLDVQPTYIRITIKDHTFQLRLPEEVHPDKGNAQRSQITGHLVVTMPKVNPPRVKKPPTANNTVSTNVEKGEMREEVRLEVKDSADKTDYKTIVDDNNKMKKPQQPQQPQKQLFGAYAATRIQDVKPRENDADFEDDDDVPPLE